MKPKKVRRGSVFVAIAPQSISEGPTLTTDGTSVSPMGPVTTSPGMRYATELVVPKSIPIATILYNFIISVIFLSKDKNIYVIDINSDNIFEYKLNLNKDEKIIHFFSHIDDVYLFTNRSQIFVINGQIVEEVADYGVFTNITPIILDDFIMIFSVFGDIYEIKLLDNSITKIDNLKSKSGISIKSNIFEDQKNKYYLYNTGTLVTLAKNNYEHYNNYILKNHSGMAIIYWRLKTQRRYILIGSASITSPSIIIVTNLVGP